MIFEYDFMIRAFLAGTAVAITLPSIGMFLVVRRYSQLSDTLSHASLLGVSIALFFHLSPSVITLGVAVLIALLIEYIRRQTKLYTESLLTVFLAGSLGLASIFFSLSEGSNGNVMSYLFGSILTVNNEDVLFIFTLSAGILFCVWKWYKEFFLLSLDEELAEAHGVSSVKYNTLLIVLSALTIGIALKIIGALLIGALLVIPVLSVLQWKKSFFFSFFLAILYAIIGVIVGLLFSYYAGTAPGGSIVMTLVCEFILSSIMMKLFVRF